MIRPILAVLLVAGSLTPLSHAAEGPRKPATPLGNAREALAKRERKWTRGQARRNALTAALKNPRLGRKTKPGAYFAALDKIARSHLVVGQVLVIAKAGPRRLVMLHNGDLRVQNTANPAAIVTEDHQKFEALPTFDASVVMRGAKAVLTRYEAETLEIGRENGDTAIAATTVAELAYKGPPYDHAGDAQGVPTTPFLSHAGVARVRDGLELIQEFPDAAVHWMPVRYQKVFKRLRELNRAATKRSGGGDERQLLVLQRVKRPGTHRESEGALVYDFAKRTFETISYSQPDGYWFPAPTALDREVTWSEIETALAGESVEVITMDRVAPIYELGILDEVSAKAFEPSAAGFPRLRRTGGKDATPQFTLQNGGLELRVNGQLAPSADALGFAEGGRYGRLKVVKTADGGLSVTGHMGTPGPYQPNWAIEVVPTPDGKVRVKVAAASTALIDLVGMSKQLPADAHNHFDRPSTALPDGSTFEFTQVVDTKSITYSGTFDRGALVWVNRLLEHHSFQVADAGRGTEE